MTRSTTVTAPALLVAACLLVAVNLRPAVVAVSPLLPVIRRDTGMGAPVAGLLTTLPVLCFGAAAPLAPDWPVGSGSSRRWAWPCSSWAPES